MKLINRFLLILILAAFVFSSCGRKAVPSSSQGKGAKNGDQSAFNYVYVEALKQKLMGNTGDALKYFEQALKLNPGSDAACFQIAQILITKQNADGAKMYANKAYSLDPSNLWYMMMLSAIYYQERNLDSAIIFYEKAVKVYPERENLQLTLGNLYSENKNYELALKLYESLDQKYGINENSTPSLIRNLIEAKKYDEALLKVNLLLKEKPDEILYNGLMAEVYRAKGDNSKAREVYSQLIKRNPDNAQIQLSLCGFLIEEKSYEDLFVLLNTVFINDKVSREDKISLVARLLENDEFIKDHGDQLILTTMILEAAFKNDPIIVLLRPEILVKEGKPEEAAEKLEEIIKVQPENYYAWEKLLLVYLQIENFDMLVMRGEECSSKFNMSFLAKVLYASGAIEKGKFAIAEEELRKAEILAGDDNDLKMQVLTMRADLYYKSKDYTRAFALFDEAVKKNSEDLTVLNNYSYYLAEQNMRLKEAEVMAKEAITRAPDNTTFLDTYAWVLYKRGKLKDAAMIMEKIIASGEKADAEWYEHYGYILKAQKKCDQAVEKWEIAVSIDTSKTHLIQEIKNCGK